MIDLHLIRHRGYTTLVQPEDGAFGLKVLGISDGIYGRVDERIKARPYFRDLVEDYLATCTSQGREPSPPPSNRALELLIKAEEADQGKGTLVSGLSEEEFFAVMRREPKAHLHLCAYGSDDSLVVEVQIADDQAAEARSLVGMDKGFEGGFLVPEGKPLAALLAFVGIDPVEEAVWYLEMLTP